MSIYLLLVAVACYATAIAPNVLYDVHMLQLSSYRTTRYWSWLRQQPLRLLHIGSILALLPLALWLIVSPVAIAIIWSVIYIILFILRKKTAQKKKLVITSRVTRILASHAVLMVLMAIFAWQVFPSGFVLLFLLLLLGLFSPLVLIVSNILTLPLEKFIGNYYYRDAQGILSQYRNLHTIGITGSYGKTSTKLVLQQLLATRFDTLATPASYNTTMGVIKVVRTLLRPIHQVFIVEMGARQQGDIEEICGLVHPKLGIITAVGEQHLETFKELSTITKTKLELFASLSSDGIGFYNADDEVLRDAVKPDSPRYVTFAIDADNADYRAVDLHCTAIGTEFTVITQSGESLKFTTRLLGRHNVYNILAAIAVSVEFGIALKDLTVAVAMLKPAPHRLEVRQTGAGVTILDDAFSSNPQGSKYALEVLATIEGKRKIMITPGMVELGTREAELNKEFGFQAAKVCDYVVLVGFERAIPINEGLIAAGFAENQVYIAKDLKDGQQHLETLLKAGDVLLYENDLPDNYNERGARK